MRHLAALLLLLLSACTATRAREKMSFDELYSKSTPPPADVKEPASSRGAASRVRPQARKSESSRVMAPDSPELRAALAAFVTRARAARAQVPRGGAMPGPQVENWREMNATLDTFLQRPARKTSSLDVVRARVTLEAELEED
ncbi:MAG TPA: M23 family peptidase, partial [Myxococcus sp.]|nr:M23 family peptidase [Myxococcus sp.]